MKAPFFLLLLLFALIVAESEERLKQCDKEQLEMKMWQVQCKQEKKSALQAKTDKIKYTDLYEKSVAKYKQILASLGAVEKAEQVSKAKAKVAQESLSKLEEREISYCSVSAAKNKTNIIVCKETREQIVSAKNSYQTANLEWEKAHKHYLHVQAQTIGLAKIKNEANDERIKYDAIFELKNKSAKFNCDHYRTLRRRFYGHGVKYDAVHQSYGYRAYHKTATFDEAQRMCQNRKGSLISIHDKFENELSAKLCSKSKNVPIGALLDKKSNTFKWLDGTKMDFTAWAKGEPNNVKKGENYAEEYTTGEKKNQWNDIHHTTFGCFVCKFSKK